MMKITFGLGLLLMGLSACTGTDNVEHTAGICEENNHAAAIVKGSKVSQQDTDSNRAVLLVIRKKNDIAFCTGVPIRRDIILTAGHCTKGVEKTDITAVFHPDGICAEGFNRATMTIDSKTFLTHEKYDGTASANSDLALIKLRSPIPHNYPIASLYDGSTPLSDDRVLMIGYGVTNEQNPNSAGRLRKTFKSFQEDAEIIDHRIGFLQNNETGGVCSGDSGGPVYVLAQNQYKLIGINSVVTGVKGKACHGASFAMYIPHYAPWIMKGLKMLQ